MAQVLVDGFLAKYGAKETEFTGKLWDSNLGKAVELNWTDELWAWLWVEREPVQVAMGWPGGSVILDYSRRCRAFAKQMDKLQDPQIARGG